jgi:glycosyltransferase involved in cell wall biosynthesis
LKLLVVTSGLERSTLDPVAGWVHESISKLAKRGHRVTVLCTRAAEPPDTPQDGHFREGDREGADDPPGVTVWRPGASDRAAVLEGLLALEPDVVHVAAPGPLPAEFTAALARAPLLIDLLDWSALCPAGDLLARPLGEECTQHHPVAPCGTCVGHAHVRAIEPFIALARAGHRAVAHASHVRDRSTFALGRGVSLVPVGVDATRFSPEPDPRSAGAPPLAPEVAAIVSERSRPRVIALGPPTPARGGPRLLDLLVALHARVPGVELVVAGTDPDNPDLMHIHLAEAKELGIAHQLRSLPRVSHADLPALLAACDVGVAPGLAPEPLGRTIVQALAVGLPVVAHASATMRELLLAGEAGLLASAAPMSRFADQVAKLLNDRAARVALGERARLAALERHDIERAIVDIEALYESLRAARRQGKGSQRRKAA